MWNFKLKRTRIILLISVVWCALAYFLLKGGSLYLFDRQQYYRFYDLWDFDLSAWLFLISPVLIYWTIPLIRGVFRWVKGGE